MQLSTSPSHPSTNERMFQGTTSLYGKLGKVSYPSDSNTSGSWNQGAMLRADARKVQDYPGTVDGSHTGAASVSNPSTHGTTANKGY